MPTITQEQIDNIVDDLGLDYEEGVYTNYSGRGMYGKTCVGFVLDSTDQILALGAALQEHLGTIPYAAKDSMGYSTIIYFSQLQLED
jgi:hypothetical protein